MRQEIEKRFDEKWERITNGGLKKSLDGKYIWDVYNGQDEDSYLFVDETLKSFFFDEILPEVFKDMSNIYLSRDYEKIIKYAKEKYNITL